MLNKSFIMALKIAAIIILVMIASPLYAAHSAQWTLGIGLGTVSLPYYRGADKKINLTAPFPYLRYRSEKITLDEDGMRGMVFAQDQLRLDLSIAAGIPVPSNKIPLRAGMPKLDTNIEIGPALEYILTQNPASGLSTRIAVPARAAFSIDSHHTDHIGWITSPYFEIRKSSNAAWRLSLALGPMYADHRYHNYYYGVASNYATVTRPSYQATAGYNGSRMTLTAVKQYKNYWLGAFIRHDWLDNSAFDNSPLLGTKHYYAAGIAVAIILKQSERRAKHASFTHK